MPPRKPASVKVRRLGCCNSRQRARLRRRLICTSPQQSSESGEDSNNNNAQAAGQGQCQDPAGQVMELLPAPEPENNINNENLPENEENFNIEEEIIINADQDLDAEESTDDSSIISSIIMELASPSPETETESSLSSLNFSGLWLLGGNSNSGHPSSSSNPSSDGSGNGSRRSSSPAADKRDIFDKFSIPKASFRRISKQILDQSRPGFRFRAVALEALQMITEEYLTKLFADCHKSASVRNSRTIKLQDLKLVVDIRENSKILFPPPGFYSRFPELADEGDSRWHGNRSIPSDDDDDEE